MLEVLSLEITLDINLEITPEITRDSIQDIALPCWCCCPSTARSDPHPSPGCANQAFHRHRGAKAVSWPRSSLSNPEYFKLGG